MADPTRQAVAAQMLTLAQQSAQAGIKEVGGNNQGPAVNKYLALFGLAPGASWCAAFVGWCAVKAYAQRSGATLTLEGIVAELVALRPHVEANYWPLSASCGAMRSEAEQRGLWRADTVTPKPGWIVFYDWAEDPNGPVEHTGIVQSITGEVLTSVEGNTRPQGGGNQSDGDGVYVRQRSTAVVAGYIATW